MNGTFDDFFEVTLCQLQNEVEGIEMLWVLRFNNIDDLNDIGMLEFSQKVNLSKDPLAVDFVLENAIHLLDGHLLA